MAEDVEAKIGPGEEICFRIHPRFDKDHHDRTNRRLPVRPRALPHQRRTFRLPHLLVPRLPAHRLQPRGQYDLSGAGDRDRRPPGEYLRTAESGNQVRRRFCTHCGCHLFADSTGRPQPTVVRVGTMDDLSSTPPIANIWSASAPAWACLDAGLERIHQQPAPPRPPRGVA